MFRNGRITELFVGLLNLVSQSMDFYELTYFTRLMTLQSSLFMIKLLCFNFTHLMGGEDKAVL